MKALEKRTITFGNWEANIDHSREAGCYPKTIVSNMYGKTVAICYNRKQFSIDKQEAEANAQLIATAPELLAALKSLLECCELNLDELEPETIAAIEQAEKVVLKATE